jgi:drug/metabolite transporter (DMT)-like permease
MKSEALWIVATALLWGSYPLVSRAADYQGHRAALILMISGFIPVALMAMLSAEGGWPTKSALVKLLVAGLMMGSGLVAFVRVANGPLEASISIPIIDVAMLLVSAIGAVLVFKEPVTVQKAAGVALLLVGIVLLRPARDTSEPRSEESSRLVSIAKPGKPR